MRQGIFPAWLAMALLLSCGARAESTMDPALREKAGRAADAGLHYLRQHQAEDGSWSESVGVTALALRAFLESHRGYNEGDGAFITRPICFIMANVRDDGSISETAQKKNYNTAVSLTALAAINNSDYATTISNGQKFLKGLQLDRARWLQARSSKYYGGIGYGGDERPDLSNQYMALEALKATATDEDDPVWDKALTFVSRAQNYSETNDQEWAGNDGGFVYMPGYSPHEGLNSYGGMTSAGLLSLLFAGADKSDPRVKAAYDWIRANYTLEENPGAGNQGLYYYYNVFAKCMYVYGETEIVDSKGVAHNWRNDLAGKLLSLQASGRLMVQPRFAAMVGGKQGPRHGLERDRAELHFARLGRTPWGCRGMYLRVSPQRRCSRWSPTMPRLPSRPMRHGAAMFIPDGQPGYLSRCSQHRAGMRRSRLPAADSATPALPASNPEPCIASG